MFLKCHTQNLGCHINLDALKQIPAIKISKMDNIDHLGQH